MDETDTKYDMDWYWRRGHNDACYDRHGNALPDDECKKRDEIEKTNLLALELEALGGSGITAAALASAPLG